MSDLTQDIRSRRTWKMKAEETTLNKNCFAVMNTAAEGQCKRPTDTAATTDRPVGVLEDATHAAGDVATYRDAGIVYAKIAAACAIGDKLVIADTAGRVTPLVPATHTSGCPIVGRCLETGTTANNVVAILLTPDEYFHS